VEIFLFFFRFTLKFVPGLPIFQEREITGYILQKDFPLERKQRYIYSQ